jgi:predicted DCC family thiol-disulfide oxidoreductase YuxK
MGIGSQLPAGARIVFFDGECGLCNALVQFLLKYDRRGQLFYAPLQGDFAEHILRRLGIDAGELNTAYFLTGWDTEAEVLYARGEAAIRMLASLGGLFSAAKVGLLLPNVVLNLGYAVVARNRYRIFGRRESCMIPTAQLRSRFVE